MADPEIQKFSDGEVYFWIEGQSSIHIKAATRFGDPVELTAEEARDVAKALMKAAQDIDPER